MRKFDRIICFVVLIFIIIISCSNIYVLKYSFSKSSRTYKVSLNRVERAIESFEKEYGRPVGNITELEQYTGNTSYDNIVEVYVLRADSDSEERSEFFNGKDEDYEVFATESSYYKIIYTENVVYGRDYVAVLNLVAVVSFVITLLILIFVRQKLIKPFHVLSELPYELSKGNLTIPVKEEKSKFFGRYLWGMDLLRENIEENKRRELELIREKKLLLLSLSHDIKTPLSVIKLYSQALGRNLYKTEEKKKDISDKISLKVDEIESYITEIVHASNEEFLNFDVNNTEFYIKEVIERIREYYTEKLLLNRIDFAIGEYSNCIVYGDADRLTEVMQNIIENAIKYGDGREISIEFEHNGEEYTISIISTGCEMEEKELVHIFDSFFRGSNVGKQPGSGLGLYICRQLMHMMDGGITVQIIGGEQDKKEITDDDGRSMEENDRDIRKMEVSVTVRIV